MARFDAVEAHANGAAIRVTFRIDTPGVIAWQLFDPATGAHLVEGEWSEQKSRDVALQITLPAEDGPYQVQVAPVADRSRFILIDAKMLAGRVEMEPPRVASRGSLRRMALLRAIPKAFVFPVRSLRNNRTLMISMVRRDILARYRGSFGGALWTFLNPLLLMLTYFFVFGVVMKTRLGGDGSRSGFVLYLLAGMLPWLAFAEAVGRAPHVILEHRNFVKKLVFPLEILPANLVFAGMVSEVFLLAIFLIALVIARGFVPITALWLPVLLIPQLLLTFGLAWFLAALGVFARDLTQIVGFILQLWFFLTPILYPEAQVLAVAPLLRFNPILVLVRAYRLIFLEGQAPPFGPLAWLSVGGVAVTVAGYVWFHRLRKTFADVI